MVFIDLEIGALYMTSILKGLMAFPNKLVHFERSVKSRYPCFGKAFERDSVALTVLGNQVNPQFHHLVEDNDSINFRIMCLTEESC